MLTLLTSSQFTLASVQVGLRGSEGRRRVAVFFLLISVFFYPIMVNKDEYNT